MSASGPPGARPQAGWPVPTGQPREGRHPPRREGLRVRRRGHAGVTSGVATGPWVASNHAETPEVERGRRRRAAPARRAAAGARRPRGESATGLGVSGTRRLHQKWTESPPLEEKESACPSRARQRARAGGAPERRPRARTVGLVDPACGAHRLELRQRKGQRTVAAAREAARFHAEWRGFAASTRNPLRNRGFSVTLLRHLRREVRVDLDDDLGHLREIVTLNEKIRPMTRTRKRGERRARNALKVK